MYEYPHPPTPNRPWVGAIGGSYRRERWTRLSDDHPQTVPGPGGAAGTGLFGAVGAVLVVPLSLLYDPELLARHRQVIRLEGLPYMESSLALAVTREDQLGPALSRALAETTRRQV